MELSELRNGKVRLFINKKGLLSGNPFKKSF
jgi:hypothetical protein